MDTIISALSLPDNYALIALACLTCLIFPISYFFLSRITPGIPILSEWSFFSKRYDFMQKNLLLSRGLPFQFRVLQHRVVGVSGPNGRRLFFNNSSLDISEGYKILRGGAPQIEDIDVPLDVPDSIRNDSIKRLHFILQKERIAEILPVLLDDINRFMLNWGREGVINPFNEVNDLVFQMTLRFTTCGDLCRDYETTKRIASLYWALEKSATPTAQLLPWFPSPAKRMKKKATSELYSLILKSVRDRRAAGAPTKDAIDALIRNGVRDDEIVTMVLGALLAGIVNTGVNSCWALLYLGTHNEWRQRAVSEIKSLISAHIDTIGNDLLHKQLASIPLSAWEDKVPSLELIIRETIRLSSSMTFFRRNLRTDIDADGVRIARGDFMAYLATDVHMNENVYSNPETFDPGRYDDGRNEDKSVYFGYLGWGAGRHPCPGMRVAKLEIKIILALLLLGYDYTIVDEQKNQTNTLPVPNRNDNIKGQPLGDPVYLKFKQVKQ